MVFGLNPRLVNFVQMIDDGPSDRMNQYSFVIADNCFGNATSGLRKS